MERNREARRSTMAAVIGGGGGLPRRRRRKESPEDGGIESPEASRFRDRGLRKDRDGSSRRKRCRRQRLLHGNSREEGEESSEESIDEDEDDDAAVRHRPESLTTSSPSQHQLQQNHHNHNNNNHHHQHQHQHQNQHRKISQSSAGRPPSVWTADEMIGVAVPRRPRSASVKRSLEYSVSGVGEGAGAGSGGAIIGEQIVREASTSPSTSQISPSSSNASIRKKMKPTSVSKHKPVKTSKSPSPTIQDDLEIEVAEVLYGLTRQFQCPAKQESHKVDSRESVAVSGNESKSSLPSVHPPSNSSSVPAATSAVAPKRKKLRPVEEENLTSVAGLPNVVTTSLLSATKIESENLTKMDASPQNEKSIVASATENGVSPIDVPPSLHQSACWDSKQESTELEKPQLDLRPSIGGSGSGIVIDNKQEAPLASKTTPTTPDVNLCEQRATSKNTGSNSHREEKFKIDLMAPPPGKLSPDSEETCNFNLEQNSTGPNTEMGLKQNIEKRDEKAIEQVVEKAEEKVEKLVQVDLNLKKQEAKGQIFELHLDMKKLGKDDACGSLQVQKQQSNAAKVETKKEKCDSTTLMNVPMTVGTWPGSFPPFGYMRQIPSLQAVIPIDGAAGGPSNALQPPVFSTQPRPKRCATHCYIAQTIHHHQKLARMNPFWSAAGGTTSLYGAKPYNLNFLPTSEAALFGNPMQGNFAGKIINPLNEGKGAPMVAAASNGHVSKEKIPPVSNAITEASLMKQSIFQHMAQSGSAPNMLNGPALVFPLNQQKAAAAAAAATNQIESTKSTTAVSNAVPSTGTSTAPGGSGNSGSATPMNLGLANEAQYLALLQNNAYPFPLPHVPGALPFRGINPGQTIPFFYQSNVLHSSQLHHHQQHQQPGLPQPPNAQQSHQKPIASTDPSSYLKHPQKSQNTVCGVGGVGTSSHGLSASYQRLHLQPQGRQQEANRCTEDNPSTADGRASNVQKGPSGQNFALPFHPQSFALMSTAAAAPVSGNVGGHGAKQPISQLPQQESSAKIMLTSPQVFAMPFASSNGASAAAPGLDFSSMMQNHIFFQSHSEAAKQGYHQIATSASFTSQPAQPKKAHLQTSEGGKSVVKGSINDKMTNIEERKITTGEKTAGISSHNSLMLTKSDSEPPVSSNPSNDVVETTSQTYNLIQVPASGSKTLNHSPATVVSTSSAEIGTVSVSTSQQHQQLFQLQKQPQHQLASSQSKTSVSSNSTSVYSERLPGGSVTKFPQTISGFPQALVQSASPNSSSQAQASTRRIAPPTASPGPAPGKVSHQPQRRSAQQHISTQSHQMTSSFGMNSLKMVNSAGQNLPGGNRNSSSVVAMTFASPSNSVSKNAGSQAPAISKPGSANPSISLPQQSSSKQSSVSASSKSSPASNMPSILGHPQNASKSSSGSKLQQPQQQKLQQPPKQQPFHQAQVFLSNAYMQQHHSLQPNMAPAAAGYYKKRQSEQSQQQHHISSMPVSNGMLAISSAPLCASSTSDPAKAMAAAAAAAATANGTKSPSVLQASQPVAVSQSASASHHSLVPATFPYMSMPAESGKCTLEQNSAAGDNLHSCWQPEKK